MGFIYEISLTTEPPVVPSDPTNPTNPTHPKHPLQVKDKLYVKYTVDGMTSNSEYFKYSASMKLPAILGPFDPSY